MRWDHLAEHQIRKAQAEGQLDDLKGAGKPLEFRGGNGVEAIGFGIMADAGVLPREIELKKAVDEQRRALSDMAEPEDRRREMKKLADLELRLAIEREARRRYYSGA
ncbi:DUF1992 domain-containing protein [Oricola sp.]|uniref:DnaJ family domain-containing protein n=1 Tax=Oricola sp. TaxID=1979950 RepID=UPI0025EA9224|nr:DUF1992 domain-containing protein [Oricola sp.]MCI5076792.1 DUF1992 domain-containing protein [Oricola sp.]